MEHTTNSTQDLNIFGKIISGGQTGADQGALDAALELDHPCGGWCPKGRKSEASRIPDKYPLQEHSSADYRVRTRANVVDSDGTLIFTYGEPTGGTALTREIAIREAKPFYIIDLMDNPPMTIDPTQRVMLYQIDFKEYPQKEKPEVVWKWGWEHEIFVLNVAGPRESNFPGTQVIVKTIVGWILEYARKCYPIVPSKITTNSLPHLTR